MAKPRKRRKPTDAISNKYFAELGRFVATYGELEFFIKTVFLRILDVEEEIGMAMTGGMRLSDIMAATRRIIIARKLDQQYYDAINAHFRSVGDLSLFRDKVVHRQIGIGEDGEVTFANYTAAKSREHVEVETVNINVLIGKTLVASTLMHDCIGFMVLTLNDWHRAAEHYRKAFPCPWIHKPVGPARPAQQPRRTIR